MIFEKHKLIHDLQCVLMALVALLAVPAAYASSYGEVQLRPSSRNTYKAVTNFFTTTSTPGDVLIINGSNTKTIVVTGVKVVQSNGFNPLGNCSTAQFSAIKRSSPDSGGVSGAVTKVPLDSNNPASTASVVYFTSNPSEGAAVGRVGLSAFGNFFSAGTAAFDTTGSLNISVYDTGSFEQGVVLRGTNEGLAINMNNVTDVAPSISIEVTWVELPN